MLPRSIYFVPRRTMLCERVLAEEGVFGDVKTGEFHLDLIPFEEDVLSLEMPSAFRECFLVSRQSACQSCFLCAKSRRRLALWPDLLVPCCCASRSSRRMATPASCFTWPSR
jgi:hypothetical protein